MNRSRIAPLVLTLLAAVSAALVAAGPAAAINPSRVSLNCKPGAAPLGALVTCIATVTDTGPQAARTVPAGTVTWTSSDAGTFEPPTCTLAGSGAFSSRCTSIYRPTRIGSGGHEITATYAGGDAHAQSTTRLAVSVVPVNDEPSGAPRLRVGAAVTGSTAGATYDVDLCDGGDDSVWYRLGPTTRGRLAIRLAARGSLDAVVAVFRRERSRLVPVACRGTGAGGRAGVGFATQRGATYLIAVAEQETSRSGSFELRLAAIAPVRLPGARLPLRGASGTLDGLEQPAQAWSVPLRPGVTYRVSAGAQGNTCVTATLYAPGSRSVEHAKPLRRLPCGGYALLTLRPGHGGTHSIVVETDTSARAPYRLLVAPAGPDDTAPGLPLGDGETRRGSVDFLAGDRVDLYRFDVPERSDVALALTGGGSGAHVVVLSDSGGRLAAGPGVRRVLEQGTYYAAVTATKGERRTYALRLLVRTLTTTRLAAPTRATPGAPLTVSATVSPGAGGGVVRFEIERLDPLAGWQFARQVVASVTGSTARLSWTPPSVGRYRIRALFLGTTTASPSAAGPVTIAVGAA